MPPIAKQVLSVVSGLAGVDIFSSIKHAPQGITKDGLDDMVDDGTFDGYMAIPGANDDGDARPPYIALTLKSSPAITP